MKSKIKRLITIALATTMLMGMSINANAAPRIPMPIPACYKCGLIITVEYKGESYLSGQVFYNWYCNYCKIAFQKHV